MGRLFSRFWVVLGIAAALAVAGCGGGGTGPSTVTKPKVRVINASPDSNPLRVDLNSDTFESAVSYLSTSTTFKEKKADTYDIAVFDDAAPQPSLWAETFSFADAKDYVIVTYGLENYGSEPIKRLRTAEIEVDLTPPVGNTARLIVFDAFNRAAGFDTPAIDFQNPGDNPQFQLTNIDYGTSQSIVVDSGNSLTFVARRNGTEQVYATSTPNLDPGGVYLVLVSGVEGASGAQAPTIIYIKLN